MTNKALKGILNFLYDVKEPPIRIIGLLLGSALVFYGLYVGGPLYVDEPGEFAAAEIWDANGVRQAFALFFIVSGALYTLSCLITGWYRNGPWREISNLAVVFSWLFLAALRLMETGWTPVTWAFALVLAAVTATTFLIMAFGDEHNGSVDSSVRT